MIETLSYSKSQTNDLVYNKGLETLFYYLTRKNQNLTSAPEEYNFYSNENPDELCKLYFISQKLLDKANRYLQDSTFFSHPILQNIALLIDHFLNLYLNYTPLAKILPFLSHLLQKLDEWNISVPRDYKITDEYDELHKLTLRWRKLERESWKDLLDGCEKKFERNDLINMIQLWNMIVHENLSVAELHPVIENFIKTTQFGTYLIRLDMLDNLKDICGKSGRSDIVDACLTITRRFKYFEEYHKSRKEETIKEFHKDIQKYQDLNKWDNRDHMRLKYSVDKYHRKLNKIMKKYEEFLETPIEVGLMEPLRKTYLTESINHFITVYEGDFVKRGGRKPKKSDLGKIRDILEGFELDTLGNFKTVYTNLVNITLGSFEVVPEKYYDFLVSDTQATRKTLRDRKKRKEPTRISRKKKANKDGIEQEEEEAEIKNMCDYLKLNTVGFFDRIRGLREENVQKTLKTKAFIDFLKFLKETGIKETSYKSESDENVIESINHNLDEYVSKLVDCGVREQVNRKISKLKRYEDRIIDYLTIIERNKQFSPELDIENIRRAENYSKSLWVYSLKMRKKLSAIVEEVSTFYKSFNSYSYVLSVSESETFFTLEFLKELQNIHAIALENISCLKMFFQTLDSCSITLDTPVLTEVTDLIAHFVGIKDFIDVFGKRELSRISKKDIEKLVALVKAILTKVETIKSSLCKEEKTEAASDFIIYSQLELIESQWLKIKAWVCELKAKKLASSTNIEGNIDLDVEDVTKSLLLFSQNRLKSTKKYINTIGKFMYDEDENEAQKEAQYRKCNDLAENEIKNISKDTKLIQDFNQKLLQCLQSREVFQTSANHAPFFHSLKLAKKIVDSQLLEHVRSVKMIEKFCYLTLSIMYNLFYRGFCSLDKTKDAQDGEGEGEGELRGAAGAGIGEGEGMENVSKEIQFEEQVLGEKGGEEEQEEQKESKKEDDGVQMENDFEGKNYDEQKPDDEEEDDKNANKDDFDDEFSEVDDDLDPKLWNDDEEENDQKDNEEDKKDEDEEGKEDPLRKEEDLEFRDHKANEETTQRAKEEEKPKDKSDKRNAKDYDEFEDKREENEMKSEGESVDEEEYKKVEDEKRHPENNKNNEDASDKDRMSEENSLQADEAEDAENKDEDGMSFDSENPGEEEKDKGTAARGRKRGDG